MGARKTRVAILGGGCAGCAAAHALSRTPEDRARFDVTIFEQSHRLGGKGATGRDPAAGHAVLEHGLHVWMGWYHRAFGVVHDVLAEHARLDAAAPFRRMEDAFEPSYTCSFPHPRDHDRLVTMALPPRPGRPGEVRGTLGRWLDDPITALSVLPRAVQGMNLDGELRRVFLALAAAVGRGLLRDVVGRGPQALLELDELDLRQWLRQHGASDEVVDAPPIRAFYDLAFAYPGGTSEPGSGSVAAGAALASIVRIFASYCGAPFWRMRAGMGDNVFAPLYEVLRHRGVKTQWMHAVRNLEVRDGAVAAVDFHVRGRPRHTDASPLVKLRTEAGELSAWPEQPIASRFEAVEHERRLIRGQDFDWVILAIPAPALPPIVDEVRHASPAFDRMLRHSAGVATRAVQLWLDQPLDQERFPQRGVCTGTPGGVASWADMSDVLPFEAWPDRQPATLLYGCDVDPGDSGSANTDSLADLERTARAQAHHRFPAHPIRHLYARRNLQPWEHYCLTLPGSTKYRLAPDEAGLSNLLLAGDWVKTTINGGSVEAAFEAGQQSAETVRAVDSLR